MSMYPSVSEVADRGLCIGCGMCLLACRSEAIRITFDKRMGLHRPIIESDKCTGCGACLDVCFGVHVDYRYDPSHNALDMLKSTLGRSLRCYIGFSTKRETRFKASSGGIVTALLEYLMDEDLIDGAIVTRTRRGVPPWAESFIGSTKIDLAGAMGSKYCPVLISDSVKSVQAGKRYALVGLPCHIYAVKSLAKKNRTLRDSIRYYIGLFCGGTPSYNGTRYILRMHGLGDSSIKNIEYRGGGWPGRMAVETASGSMVIPYTKYWSTLSPWFFLSRCMVCLSGLNIQSDISCGDAWLPEILAEDKTGTSIISSRTRLGDQLVQEATARRYINTKQVDRSVLLRSQRAMLDFKHFSLVHRVRLLNLFTRTRVFFRQKPKGGLRAGPTAYLYEFVQLVGRQLASREAFWPILRPYALARDRFL
jgi:coenzyme F420 hydrogenase subunit beta